MNLTHVRDKTFYGCTVHGPVILTPQNTRFAGNNKFITGVPEREHTDSMLYPLDLVRAQTWYSGTVGVRNCMFRDCTFVDVGFMQDGPHIQKLRHHIDGGGDIEI